MTSEHLNDTFAALADPTRRAILARLSSGEASVTQLAEPFEISMPAVSKHLKVLERAGLIARGREAQWRPCRLEAARLKEVADWVAHYQRFWSESFDRLDEYLRNVQSSERGKSNELQPGEKSQREEKVRPQEVQPEEKKDHVRKPKRK
jgi:DNA-binding transcriptional ArsR family regulator